jgi:hypothetical protein
VRLLTLIPIFTVVTHRRLERWRVSIPYPIFCGLVTFVFVAPISVVFVALHPHDWLSLLLLPFIAAIPMVGLYSLLAAAGWLSGHRAFEVKWTITDPASVRMLVHKVQDAATAIGADTMWVRDDVGFVGVIGMEMEGKRFIHSTAGAPVRISLLCRGDKATVKVSGRTVVIWDSGERERFAIIGQDLLRRASLDSHLETPGP